MYRLHSGLTVAAPVKGNSKDLKILLQSLDTNNTGAPSVFGNSVTTLFASGVILPPQDYHGEMLPETFVFSTTCCGRRCDHISDLLNNNADVLKQIFSHCCGFQPGEADNNQYLRSFIDKHSYSGTFSSGYNLFTRDDVSKEKDLRIVIRKYIDQAMDAGTFNGLGAAAIKNLISGHIRSLGNDYAWAMQPFKLQFREWIHLKAMYLLKYLLLIILILTFLLPLVILLYINRIKTKPAERPDDGKVREVAITQLNPVINGMTAAAPLKKGRTRKWFYALALKIIGFVSPIVVKVPTVSSIRWIVLDKKRRLLFQSNYSNTTDFYVRDFLNGKTPRGVNFMFSNGMGFPDAVLSIFGGIRKHPEEYMNAVHSGQHAMDLWYVHEKTLTIDIIQNNRQIRNGLSKNMDERAAAQWLRLL